MAASDLMLSTVLGTLRLHPDVPNDRSTIPITDSLAGGAAAAAAAASTGGTRAPYTCGVEFQLEWVVHIGVVNMYRLHWRECSCGWLLDHVAEAVL